MVTDAERREVARRLRKARGLTEFAEVLGFSWDDDSVCFECMEGCDEPEYTLYDTIMTAITRYKHGESGLPPEMLVNRDALLALADKLEMNSEFMEELTNMPAVSAA